MTIAGINTDGDIPFSLQVRFKTHNFVRYFQISPYLYFDTFQFLLALNFYATGSYQNQANAYSQVSASTFGKYLHKISKFIAEVMAETYIRFPQSIEER